MQKWASISETDRRLIRAINDDWSKKKLNEELVWLSWEGFTMWYIRSEYENSGGERTRGGERIKVYCADMVGSRKIFWQRALYIGVVAPQRWKEEPCERKDLGSLSHPTLLLPWVFSVNTLDWSVLCSCYSFNSEVLNSLVVYSVVQKKQNLDGIKN